ncbi:hypothetical protein [Geothrix sp.]|jgi:hypothetical protein|uniref:hypothetical protein n=1 Tax=Geothrix sp. TaxID=1962974 RepID=UPI0025C0738C|nr:hypothetical protein [Geothrix sp.]
MLHLLYETLQIVATLCFMGFLAWLWAQRAQRQMELHRLHLLGRNHLLESFESHQALLDFAATEVGQTLLGPPAPAPLLAPRPRREGLLLIQTGLASLFLGLGLRSTYYIAMNWRAANLTLNETEAWRRALTFAQWGQIGIWLGSALILGGALAALLAHRGARPEPKP